MPSIKQEEMDVSSSGDAKVRLKEFQLINTSVPPASHSQGKISVRIQSLERCNLIINTADSWWYNPFTLLLVISSLSIQYQYKVARVFITGSSKKQDYVSKFRSKLRVDIVKRPENNVMDLEFDMIGLDPSVANAIRRILISEVPSMAIEKVSMCCFSITCTSF